jgi:DNA invertase Pin-like site-specific DNA recombinase
MKTSNQKKAIGYARISTNSTEQKHSLDYQKEKIEAYATLINAKLVKVEKEQATGRKISKRPKLQALLERKNFDVLICTKIDRLARNIFELQQIIETCKKNGVAVVFVENQIDTSTANGKLFLNILGSFAEFEAEIISERIKAGLETAKKKGVVLGRPKGRKAFVEEKVAKIRSLRKARKSWEEIAGILGYKNKSGVFNFWKRNKGNP